MSAAFRVSKLVDHEIELLTLMLPVPALSPEVVSGVLPLSVLTVTLPLLKAVEMAPAKLSSMVMSTGSITHCPEVPLRAEVSTLALAAICSFCAEVSM